MPKTNRMIRRVINGRVFKQVAALCGNKLRLRGETEDIIARDGGASVLEDGVLSPDAGSLDADQRNASNDLIHSNQRNTSSSSTQPKPQNSSTNLRLCDGLGHSTALNENSGEDSKGAPKNTRDESQQITERLPINSQYPEIMSFEDRDGEICSAVTLTEQMLRRWNTVFHWEGKIAFYHNEIHQLQGTRARIENRIADIGERIEREARNVHFNKGRALDQRNRGVDIRLEMMDEEEKLYSKIQRAQKKLDISRRELSGSWKELLAENNLLEQNLDDSEADSQSSGYPDDQVLSAINNPRAPTSSETAKFAASDEREAAAENLHDKEVRMHGARRQVDHWNEYYESEYKRYCAGTASPSKTVFDNTMLRDQMAATKLLITAEKEFDTARNQARELGVDNNDLDQESGFLDNVEDGYRGSMEVAIAKHVDRDRIVKWMEAEERPSSPHENEGEEWESKTIDLGDSVSVVAEGKERERIDRWRSICEMIEVEVPRGGESSEGP